ncbi:hypothetical protein CRG98_001607 [Punica granatum]|uniref:Uncharacterized protein n=1 Tax=Punica granatum TaxID=22663 RepID=A0A2I0LBE2_PUNGR|nr:hypothetical protein CRG98_001607 [Punica granatum]
MAAMNKVVCVLLLSLIAISMVATQVMAKEAQYHLDSCSRRCSRTQYHKPCMFFCQKCCRKCLCVPPGFYGNKQVCPCYNNWKTKEGGPKCP